MADVNQGQQPGYSTGDQLAQEAARLRVEIAQTKYTASLVDTDGTPSPDAMMAQKRLPQLNDDYRALLQELSTPPKTIATADGRTLQLNPQTNQYDIELGAKAPTVTRPPAPQGGGQSDPFIWKFDVTKNDWVQENNPAYRAPAAPQGPAFSGTEQGIRLASDLDIARDALGSDQDLSRSLVVQGQAFDLNMIRDKATAEAAMAAKAAERDALRADLIWKLQNGVIVTPEADAALKQWDAMNTADYQAHARRVLDIEDYNRKLPQLQAQEDRAARQDQRETNAPKVSALKGQADAGMSAADRMVKLGVSPSDASLRMAYDPYPRMWAILNEKPATGPQLQTQVAPAAPTPRPAPNVVPPQFAPAAPGAGMTAPPAPYGGDLEAQAAFEAEYPGQDPEAIWREQNAANRAPAAPGR